MRPAEASARGDATPTADLPPLERRYRAQFDQTAMPQMVLDLGGRVIDANDAMCDLVGLSRSRLIGRTTVQLHHPSDIATGRQRGEDLFHGRVDTAVWERVFAAGDGTALPLLIHSSLIRDADGAPDSVHAFVQDLTALRRAEGNLTRSTARFEALLQEATDFAVVTDAEGSIVYASPAIAATFGHEPAALIGRRWHEFIHRDDADAMRATWERVCDEPLLRQRMVFRFAAADDRWVSVEVTLTNRLDHPEIAGIVCNGRDVSERMAAEAAIRASEMRYRAIAETAQEGIWVGDRSGRTLFANRKAADILGVSVETVYALTGPQLLTPSDPSLLLDRPAERAERGAEIYELPYLHPDGRRRDLRLSVSPMMEDGRAASLAMISDVTEMRAAEEQLRSRALHDELTGLANRTLMVDRIEHALLRQPRSPDRHVAVLLADLDDFKLVNDSWGHAAGDELLRQVANRLSSVIRTADTVARFGGDEFVILCESVTAAEAEQVAQRVLRFLSEPFTIAEHPVYVAASIGIALAPPHDAATLLQYADTAMYDAKSRGPGRLQLFDVALAENAAEHLTLGNDLRVALDGRGLELHYQPIVAIDSGRLVGVEGLARWHHPVRGNVPPSTFVPIAERLGLAPSLDRWAITRGVADGHVLRAALDPDLHVAVNISAANVSDGTLEQYVAAVDAGTGSAAPLLVLEITENAFMQNPAAARATLERLHAHGVEAAIDDFGTGYSSLAYLSRLPVQTLKIDRSFVAQLDTDPHARGITAAIIDLARTLGLRTIAEGVETIGQLRLLRELGCWAAQGFLWSPAVPRAALVDLVQGLPNGCFPVTTD